MTSKTADPILQSEEEGFDNTSNSTASTDSNGLAVGEVVGIALGSAAFAATAVLLVMHKRHNGHQNDLKDDTTCMPTTDPSNSLPDI